jgi:GH24 family phage-related lysozyme (muramidase)
MYTINISKAIALIKKYEGFSPKAYRCPAGVLTIAYGHTSGVKEGDTVTQEQAETLLYDDIAPIYIKVASYDNKYHWNENEFCALLSFGYNLGVNSINQLTAQGSRSKAEIADAILKYNKANGKVLDGLVTRRHAERALFLKPVVSGLSDQEITGLNHKEDNN